MERGEAIKVLKEDKQGWQDAVNSWKADPEQNHPESIERGERIIKALTYAIALMERVDSTPENVLSLAIFMHNKYESLAKTFGWKSQECCQTPWETLPTANQQVMLGLAQAIVAFLKEGK